MNTVIFLLATFGLAFFVKESDGPFGIMGRIRNALMTNRFVGVFFYQLLSCYLCVGFWCGIIAYSLMCQSWQWNMALVHGLAGGAGCLLLGAALNKLYEVKQ